MFSLSNNKIVNVFDIIVQIQRIEKKTRKTQKLKKQKPSTKFFSSTFLTLKIETQEINLQKKTIFFI